MIRSISTSFGALLLCFSFRHAGREHECVFVEYLYPEAGQQDGLPLETRYSHTRKRVLAVVPVEAVLFLAPLFTVLPMKVGGGQAQRAPGAGLRAERRHLHQPLAACAR